MRTILKSKLVMHIFILSTRILKYAVNLLYSSVPATFDGVTTSKRGRRRKKRRGRKKKKKENETVKL